MSQSSNTKIIRAQLSYTSRNLLLLFVFLLVAYASFQAGIYWRNEVAYERDTLLEEKQQLHADLNLEKIQHAALRIENENVQLAVASVRNNNTQLQQQIADLEEEVTYYQRVLNPVRNDKGLRIESFELEPTSDPQRFRINVVLTQLGKENRTVTQGLLKVEVEGSLWGEKQSYQLADLKLDDAELAAKFRFRYYQEISEEILLPEGFTPEKVKLVAQSTGKKAMKVERIEDWLIKAES